MPKAQGAKVVLNKDGKPRKQMGRPRIKLNDDNLRVFAGFKFTLKTVARLMGCSEDTVERHIREKYNQTYAEFRNDSLEETRFRLISKALEMAQNGHYKALELSLVNVADWVKNKDGTFEVMDGQQRTISFCEYVAGKFSLNFQYFHNLEENEK